MKTKITLLVAAVALITLSFTFVGVDPTQTNNQTAPTSNSVETPVGGMLADEVVR